ncbi:MAG TPA: thioredoxin family protein [Steroidobacteraceae bacterium]|nr:thioredoxin family protein [Steroidobacteraceae bacterium]
MNGSGTSVGVFPRLACAFAIGSMVAGCGQHTPAPPSASAARASSPVPAAAGPGIAWYAGSVESAFAAARAQHKPVFLYWGAKWCPPCHELKATVFSRPDFIQKLKLFVPVYLDGDDPGAQKWGEKFGVSGYPTVLVLNADQGELARISGGMDLSQYAEVLDLVLGDVRPVGTLLTELRSQEGRALSQDDCRRLAYYGWDVADEVNSRSGDLAQLLARAAARCPAGATPEKARLIVTAAGLAADAEAKSLAAGKPPGASLTALIAEVDAILKQPRLADDIADAVAGLDDSFFKAVASAAPGDRQGWNQRFAAVMDTAASDPRFSTADHLYSIYAKLLAAKTLDPGHQIAPGLAAAAKARIDAALAEKLDEHTRASVVNAALNILDLLGDDDRAYAIARVQMAQSKSPYYYMLDLASLDEKRGHTDSAVDWLARAYAQSQGAATRFQWGTDYLFGLIRMKPEDDATIRSAGLAVLGELDGPDRIYRRTRMRLERLDHTLERWNANGRHAATIAALKKRMDGICSQIPGSDPANATCREFLATKTARS